MEKRTRLWWSISLLVIACVTILWTVCRFAHIELPDTVTRILGILDICAIPVLIFTAIKLKKDKQ